MPMFLNPPFWQFTLLSKCFRAPELTYVLRCSDLCEDFEEDLQFHFSLGLNTLLVRSLNFSCYLSPPSPFCTLTYWPMFIFFQTTVNAGSWVSSLQTQLARIQSIISLEYGVPLLLVVAAVLVSCHLRLKYMLHLNCVVHHLCFPWRSLLGVSAMTIVFPACSSSFHS